MLLSEIPHYISAESPERLRSLMLKNNMRLNSWVNYKYIQYVDGKWYAWYYIDVEKEIILKENEKQLESNTKE
jgi:hypothetical protein